MKNWKCVPEDYQWKAYLERRDTLNWGHWWDQGTGKTPVTLAQAAHLYREGKINAMLVLAPAGVEANWVRTEIPKHWPDIDMRSFWWSSKKSGTKKYAAAYERFISKGDHMKILCMSYNAMMTDRGAKACRKFMDDHDVFYVLDESTAIKTPDAKTTKRVVASAKHARYRRCLNGTPVEDSPFALYTQIKFLDPYVWTSRGINTYTQFKSMFGIWKTAILGNGKSFPQLADYRNLDLLKECMYEAGDRILKEDCLKLPPKVFTKVYFDMTPTQWKLTDELKMHYTAQSASGEAIDAELAIVRLTRYQQIASGYFPKGEDDDELVPIMAVNPRIAALGSALDTVSGSVIIFAKYLMDIEAIKVLLKKRNMTWGTYVGATEEDRRETIKDLFQRGEIQVFLANKSAAKGLTLTAASTVIFYNNLFSADIRKQQEDRAHRIGQTKTVRYIDIVAADSVDEHILATLRRKKDVASIVTGDQLTDWI